MNVLKVSLTVCALLALSAFSGCIGDADDADPAKAGTDEPPAKAPEAKVTETTGSVKGEVRNVDFENVVNAEVVLVETVGTDDEKSTTVAKDGMFTMNEVAPGAYTIFVSAINHESMRKSVVVKAGEVAEVSFLLERIVDPTKPYVDVREYVGKVGWAVAWQLEGPAGCVVGPDNFVMTPKTCGGLRSGEEADVADSDNGEVAIEVPERAHTVFAAMMWSPAGPLGENLQLDLMCPAVPRGSNGAVLDTEHDCYWDSPGKTSPLIHRVDKADWEEKGYNHTGAWATRVFATHGMVGTYDLTKLDAGAAYEQAFTIYTEVWVNQDAPAEHTPLPDK